ncbi:hypothetical protein [Alteromonas sp. C1M14]|uniref:hypothetical protein n=1 Tax=Alteromonas sp. C1M14 TaxID=2841567 RepID=UPI001C09A6D3|nr:hypothetical protein [Alteromonas sp. C1M14]MBU2979771.1 hypothetical protein [Alteromonas sp. C1M14]
MEIQPGLKLIRPEQAPQHEKPGRNAGKNSASPSTVSPVSDVPLLRTNPSDETLHSANKFQQETGYDQPEGKGREVVAAYQSLERESQRESIRQMLGVDMYV